MAEEKGPVTPLMGEGEGEGKGEGAGEGKPGEGEKTPDVQGQLKVLSGKITDLEGKNEELSGRNEVLQDSLDSALEEMSLRSGSLKAEGESGEGEGEGEEKPGEGEGKPAEVEKEIEASIKQEEDFRTQQEEKIEGILTRETVRDLEEQVKSALGTYPNASESEILFAVEEGSEKSVDELAKVSHDKRVIELEDLKTKNIEEYKEQLKKEEEGGTSVPQSPGTSKAPETPKASSVTPPNVSEDEAWGEALDKAKVESGGA